MSIDIPCITIREFSDCFSGDLYDGYAEIFSTSPLRVCKLEGKQSESAIVFSRFDQVKLILEQHQLTSKESDNRSNLLDVSNAFSGSLLFKDDSEHQALKKIFAQYFRRVPVSRYHELTTSMARKYFDDASLKGRLDDFEIMSGFCQKLPMTIVMQLLGFPMDARQQISLLSIKISHGIDNINASKGDKDVKDSAFSTLLEIIEEGILGKWEFSSQSLMSNIRSLIHSKQISMSCASSNIALLLFAGQETTAALIGSMIYCLASFPQQLSILRRNRELVDSAIEEVLRFESPLQRATFRSIRKSFNLHGLNFSEGEEIILLIGAANRDEKIFVKPNEFIISRTPNPHLSFGKGSYHCLGRQLAIVEARAVCNFLLSRFSGSWHLNKAEWGSSTLLRCLKRLHVNFNAG
uniref:cytochrome P450 n=1 Tax=Synechococcus sp. UW106 TaxID=368495 RepID=UPI000E0F14F1|nr:cytochrome P450 [Synechococcus sp. UW106]